MAAPAATPSLFSEQTDTVSPQPPLPGETGYGLSMETRPPQINNPFVSPALRPPPPPNRFETLRPANQSGSAVINPTLRSGGNPSLSGVNLPMSLSPLAAQFRLPGSVEIVGGDPRL
jgi:hypothetical protein